MDESPPQENESGHIINDVKQETMIRILKVKIEDIGTDSAEDGICLQRPEAVTNEKRVPNKRLNVQIEDIGTDSAEDGICLQRPEAVTNEKRVPNKRKMKRPKKKQLPLPRRPKYQVLPNVRARFSEEQIAKNRKPAERNRELLESLKKEKENNGKVEKQNVDLHSEEREKSPDPNLPLNRMVEEIVKNREQVSQDEIELKALYNIELDSKKSIEKLADLTAEGESKRM